MPTTKITAIKDSYRRAPVFASPYFDEATNHFLVGNDKYPAKHETHPKEGNLWVAMIHGLRVTDQTEYRYEDGMEFDNTPQMQFKLQVLKDQKWVADNLQSINPSSEQRFYIVDETADAIAIVKKADSVFEALTIIKQLSASDKMNFCFFMGQPARVMSEEQHDAYVRNMALTQPDEVLKRLAEGDWKIRAWIAKLVHYGILNSEGGQYKYNSNVLGIDLDAMTAFVKNKKENGLICSQLSDMLKEKQAQAAEKSPEGLIPEINEA